MSFSSALRNEALALDGQVDRTGEEAFQKTVEEYLKTHAKTPVLDMSNVPFFSSSAAKLLINLAQDSESAGARIKILASKPVLQTLNLLGARKWLDAELTARTEAKPAQPEAPASAAPTAPTASPPAPKTPAQPRIHSGPASAYQPKVQFNAGTGADPANKPTKPAKPAKPATGAPMPTQRNLLMGVIAEPGDQELQEAIDLAGQPLLAPETELPDQLAILTHLQYLGSYTFHFVGQEQSVTAKVVKHLGGNWLLTDSKGSRRLVNLSQVTFIDRLS